ncbi:MAG: hypothetical protein GXO27_04550 [Chlorobi bacterium]|nr:hypothetical protein [Chlorobiota bacterium]
MYIPDHILFPGPGGKDREGFTLPSGLAGPYAARQSSRPLCYRGGQFTELFALKQGLKLRPVSIPVVATEENLERIGYRSIGRWYKKIEHPEVEVYAVWVAQRFEILEHREFPSCFVRMMRMLYHPREHGDTPFDDIEWLQMSLTARYKYGLSIRYRLMPGRYAAGDEVHFGTRFPGFMNKYIMDKWLDDFLAYTREFQVIFWDKEGRLPVHLNKHWGKRDIIAMDRPAIIPPRAMELVEESRSYKNFPSLERPRRKYWEEER